MSTEQPTRSVQLWCHACKAFVPILPVYVATAGRGAVHHVTPAAWRSHRDTHPLEAHA